jgi:thiol-disulfide isomerase/thioredoxin
MDWPADAPWDFPWVVGAAGPSWAGADEGALVMSEVRASESGGRPRRSGPALAFWGAALIGVAVAVYVIAGALIKPAGDLKSLAHGQMAKLEVTANGKPPPTTPLLDANGRAITLADIKAPVVIVNLWATWCAPCVKEMPTLATLQSAYPGQVAVVAVSMDRLADREHARAFIAQHPPLAFYQDPKYALAFALEPPVEGFPTTVIYDGRGRERARLAGAADWDGPDARALVQRLRGRR